ncbi:MAG: pyridoxal-phosphate dependent enzyme [Patescibacteria group bacterium]
METKRPFESREVPQIQTEFQARLHEKEVRAGLTDEELEGLTQEQRYERIETLVGNTPKIEVPLVNGNVLIQSDETANPTENHYDRVYLHLLHELEKEGIIAHGDTLLETTSGSAGISFSWMCNKLGFKPVVFTPGFIPEARRTELEHLAEVHYSDDRERYLQACAEMMVRYLRENKDKVKTTGHKIWMPNHSQDPRTPSAFHSLADEVAQKYPGQPIDYFIGGVGNGSTILGIAERLKQINPNTKVIGFEPMEACPYYKRYKDRWGHVAPRFVRDEDVPEGYSFHELPGTGGFGNIAFPFMTEAVERGLVDDVVPVPDKQILDMLKYNEGLPPEQQQGHTSLIAHYIADIWAQHTQGKRFVSMVYDKADRYGKPRLLS